MLIKFNLLQKNEAIYVSLYSLFVALMGGGSTLFVYSGLFFGYFILIPLLIFPLIMNIIWKILKRGNNFIEKQNRLIGWAILVLFFMPIIAVGAVGGQQSTPIGYAFDFLFLIPATIVFGKLFFKQKKLGILAYCFLVEFGLVVYGLFNVILLFLCINFEEKFLGGSVEPSFGLLANFITVPFVVFIVWNLIHRICKPNLLSFLITSCASSLIASSISYNFFFILPTNFDTLQHLTIYAQKVGKLCFLICLINSILFSILYWFLRPRLYLSTQHPSKEVFA